MSTSFSAEIGIDAYTLYEYMVRNSDNRMYKGGLLEACKILGLKNHDHARSQYTRELKASGLVTSRGRTGWQINPSRMPLVKVMSTGATVAELLDTGVDPQSITPTPVEETPASIPEPATATPEDHGSYSGAQLAEAVARELIDRLFLMDKQLTDLKRRPANPTVDRTPEIQALEAKHAELTQEYETFMETAQQNETELSEKLHSAEAAKREAEAKVAALQNEVASLMRKVAGGQPGEDFKAAAERFLHRSAAS